MQRPKPRLTCRSGASGRHGRAASSNCGGGSLARYLRRCNTLIQIRGRNGGRTDVPGESDDKELMEQLRQIAARLDPVPQRLLEAAVASYTWRTIDSDLAELVFDSLADDDVALVRGPEHARLLSFEASGLTIDVEVTGTGPDRRITRQLPPPHPPTVATPHRLDTTAPDTDELGRFSGPLRPGPFSLTRSKGTDPHRPRATDWIAL